MNPHHAQIKRASVIDFNEIKADIEESIERAHIDVGAAVLNREPKSQEEIDEERASLRSLLVQFVLSRTKRSGNQSYTSTVTTFLMSLPISVILTGTLTACTPSSMTAYTNVLDPTLLTNLSSW